MPSPIPLVEPVTSAVLPFNMNPLNCRSATLPVFAMPANAARLSPPTRDLRRRCRGLRPRRHRFTMRATAADDRSCRVAVSRCIAQPGRGDARRLHPLRQMRRGLPDGRAGRDRPGATRMRRSSRACSTCSPAAPAPRRPSAGRRSAPTAASASRPAITASTRALWSTWRGSPPKAKQGDAAVRRAAHEYFNDDGPQHARHLAAAVGARGAGADQPAAARRRANTPSTPDIVFYTGCNVIKTPHIALLVLEVLDALGVSYEVMGGTATCCGIQQFKQGDAKTAGRVGLQHDRPAGAARARRGSSRGARAARSRSARSRCRPIENRSARCRSTWTRSPSSSPSGSTICGRCSCIRSTSASRCRSAPRCRASWRRSKRCCGAIPGLEVVELDVPVVSTQASHLSVLPKFKAELREREFRAAAEAGVTTFASVFHGCHRELVKFQPRGRRSSC